MLINRLNPLLGFLFVLRPEFKAHIVPIEGQFERTTRQEKVNDELCSYVMSTYLDLPCLALSVT